MGSTVERKETPVLRTRYSGPEPHETCTPLNSLLRRRLLLQIGAWTPKSAKFVKNGAHYFLKNADRVPFGWILHKSGSEKCPNRPFWMADRLNYRQG
jgi:hypothetical protein